MGIARRAAVLAVAFLVAGCGSSVTPAPVPSPAPSAAPAGQAGTKGQAGTPVANSATQGPIPTTGPTQGAGVAPTPASSPVPTAVAIASPTAARGPAPRLVTSVADNQRDYQRFVNRKPLSAADRRVRGALIENLHRSLGIAAPESFEGVIYADASAILEYISGPDDFEVAILSPDFDLAKRNVEAYLARQGLSPVGICDLPLTYYVFWKLRESLPWGTHFDPNPLACG